MKALNHKWISTAMLLLVMLLAIAGCQPASKEQPAATPTLPPPTATEMVTPATSTTYTPFPSITHIYAFGDEHSDNGNWLRNAREKVAQGKFDAEILNWIETHNWQGRFSNGPNSVEVLAERLNVGLTDYAFLGATSGYNNEDNELNGKTGLLSQIDKFESDLNGENANADALYFIFATARDLYLSSDDFNGNPTHDKKIAAERADQAVVNITDAVTRLAELGARHFMVVNSIDLSTLPVFVKYGSVDVATAYQSRIKSELPSKMENLAKQLNVKIVFFDFLAASDRIRSNPDKYGFTEINEPCVVFTELTAAGTVVCESPDEYFFWILDTLTRRVHQILGEAMAEQLSK